MKTTCKIAFVGLCAAIVMLPPSNGGMSKTSPVEELQDWDLLNAAPMEQQGKRDGRDDESDFVTLSETSYLFNNSVALLEILPPPDSVGMQEFAVARDDGNLDAQAVPEPASLSVLFVGAAGLLMRRRR